MKYLLSIISVFIFLKKVASNTLLFDTYGFYSYEKVYDISKDRKYFVSAKDLALIDSLIKDGFKIPSNFNYNDLASKYDVPDNLVKLIKNNQNAFVALKIVEIIGEDEPYQLDSETIYFITNLLNEMSLTKIRNKVLISALPQRV